MGDVEVRALNEVNLTIEQGEYCSIIGTSGSGKSVSYTHLRAHET